MQENFKHTPGPWTAAGRGVFAGEQKIGETEHHDDAEKYYGSCANARLIAAAPELLEALQECAKKLKSQGMPEWAIPIYQKATEAIKQATNPTLHKLEEQGRKEANEVFDAITKRTPEDRPAGQTPEDLPKNFTSRDTDPVAWYAANPNE